MSSGRDIGRALARLFMATKRNGDRPVAVPGCEYGLVVEERLENLAEELAEIKALLKALVLALVGACLALVADIVVKGVL